MTGRSAINSIPSTDIIIMNSVTPNCVTRVCLFLVVVEYYYLVTSYEIQKTGIRRNIQWKYQLPPVPLHNEIMLLKSGVLVRRGEFGKLYEDRFDEVDEQCQQLQMTVHQGLLIRSQLLKCKVMRTSWKLKDPTEFRNIQTKFEDQQRSLLDLSMEYDIPPVSIIRAVVTDRVNQRLPKLPGPERKQIVKSVIGEQDSEHVTTFLTTDWELQQLQQAKEFDMASYDVESGTPVLWEEALYAYLSQLGINFVTEETLREKGRKVTPDCLILDDLYINGNLVRWIDAKSFYGSGLKENSHFKNRVKKQIHNYETEYGESGAFLFRHGFSRNFARDNPSTVFLDCGPLSI